MVNLVLYCLGAGLMAAAIFFPLTYLAMRSMFAFQGGLGKAWKPFGYSVLLLAVAKFVELGTGASQDTMTAAGFVWFMVVPILICALVLHFTYRIKTVATPPKV